MKSLLIVSFVFPLFFSCKDNIASSIPGTYVRAFKGEYSTGNDTLVITSPDGGNSIYTIVHNSSYRRIIENELQAAEYKSEKWTAILDERDNTLLEQRKGKRIAFIPGENKLLLGASEFQKIQ